MISRRQLLYFSAILSACAPVAAVNCFAVTGDTSNDKRYQLTIALLKEAYWAEKIATEHYDEYSQKALSENYPNISYLFSALSISEKIHAKNYEKLIKTLGSTIKDNEIYVDIGGTKENLNISAIQELEKMNVFYPRIIRELSEESHDQSVLNCMYSWKSHQQHEKIITNVKRYSGLFFNRLADEIENMNPNYQVCEICGSTIDEPTDTPCDICNYPAYHYKKLDRPLLKMS